MQTGKLCAKCGKEPRATSHVSYCRPCWNAYQSVYRKARYASEPEYRERIKGKIRTHRYGISEDEYAELLRGQAGVCAVCLAEPKGMALCIDHNHETGAIRGLLCSRCNGAIGMLKEDPKLFASALEYLRAHA